MIQTLWTQEYTASSFLMNPQKKLGLLGVLNLLQDIAWLHADHLGFGYEQMLRDETLWALTRQKLHMREWPSWGDRVEIRTWSRAPKGPMAYREFEIWNGGKKVGECSTSWLALDLNTRRPVGLKSFSDSGMHHSENLLSFEAKRVDSLEGAATLAVFTVRHSDLDLNGHVNNTRYAQWILDSLPPEAHRSKKLHGYEVNFLAETHLGDEIAVQALTINEAGPALHHFQGMRAGKPVFTARLEVE